MFYITAKFRSDCKRKDSQVPCNVYAVVDEVNVKVVGFDRLLKGFHWDLTVCSVDTVLMCFGGFKHIASIIVVLLD